MGYASASFALRLSSPILFQDHQEHNLTNGVTNLTRSHLDDLLCTKAYWAPPRVSPIFPTLLYGSEAFYRPAATIAPYPPAPRPTIVASIARQPLLTQVLHVSYECLSPLLFGAHQGIIPGSSCQFSIAAGTDAGSRAPHKGALALHD